jgi:CubicO group peptidase (beta-lactamase class C family)
MKNLDLAFLFVLFQLNSAVADTSLSFTSLPEVTESKRLEFNNAFPELMKRYSISSMGIGLIKNSELVYTGYFGYQRENVPVNAKTQFDVASITKTMTAETVLRLVSEGRISLEEPMANYWVDPDLANDPRHLKLTPRMALNHSTGFPNWRYFTADGTLIFESEPGQSYTYSGEAYEYLASMIEHKLEMPFDSLVRKYVIEPLGLKNTYFHVAQDNFSNLNEALTKDGEHLGHYCFPWGGCRNEGSWAASDDLRISVEDFATYLKSVMNGDGYHADLLAERNTVQTDMSTSPESVMIVCERLPKEKCPIKQGYGLGWIVADYGKSLMLSHGGSDWSEVTETYFYTNTNDGLIVFINGPNSKSLSMMLHVLKLLDPQSPKIPHYQQWIESQLEDN